MHDRRGYPGRGGRAARRRSSRFPAGPFPTWLAFGAAVALGLVACGSPEPDAARSTQAGDFGSRYPTVAAPAQASTRPFRIEKLPPSKLRLTGSASSLDDLLLTLAVALAEHDTTRLLALMIDEREYREILYPALPAAHPPISAGFETLWVTHFPDAYRGLMLLLRKYGGRDIRILNLRFDRPDQNFVNFTLHETSHVDAEIDGVREDKLRLFGSVVRVGDQWKMLSYPDD